MIRLPFLPGLIYLAVVLVGCGRFAEVDAAARTRITGPTVPPKIRPINTIRDQAALIAITDADTAAIQERALTLQSRAVGLEAPVGDPATVARLTAALPAP